MRKLLIVVGVLALLVVALLLILPRFFNAEEQRRLIATRLETALQRKVKLGPLSLSLLPPSLEMKDLEISEDPAFGSAPFLTAEKLKVRVELRPLLDGRLEVPGIEVAKPAVRLVKNTRGDWNFSSLGGTEPRPSGSGGKAQKSPQFSIESLSVSEGTFTLVDEKNKGRPLVLDQAEVKLNHIAGNAAEYDVSLHMPGRGKGLLKTEGQAAGASRIKGKLHLESVDLQSLESWLAQPGLAGLATGDIDYAYDGSTGPLAGSLEIAELRLDPKGRPAQAPVHATFQMQYFNQPERVEIKSLDLVTGKSSARLAGRLDLARGTNTNITVRAAKNQLGDIAKILPALAVNLPGSFTSGTLDGNVALRGPFATLSGKTELTINEAKLAGYSISNQLSTIARLAGVPGGKDTDIQRFHATLNMLNGEINSNDIELLVPGMNITGAGQVGKNRTLNLKMLATMTSASGAAGASGVLGGLLGRVTRGSNQIPFLITGSLDHPAFLPDTGRLLKQQIQSRTGTTGTESGPGGLDKVLGGLFGKKKQQ